MKQSICAILAAFSLFSTTLPARADAWFSCGSLSQISGCQLVNFPLLQYEYGISYNTSEPLPVTCAFWNYGMRVFNKDPYFVHSDDPGSFLLWGGFMFYRDTLSTDDDTCSGLAPWRHRYWHIADDGSVYPDWGNGCYGDLTIFCRLR